jgi:hypothetical protein
MKWFRFYSDSMHDPKVQKLPAEVFRTWVNLLCIASQNDGSLGGDESNIAFVLRMTTAQVHKHIQALKDAGLLDGDGDMRPHNWDGRQYDSDSSTARVQRYRKRQRNVSEAVTETVGNEKCNGPEQNRTEQSNASDVSRFDEFWQSYPKRADRRHAEKAYVSALKRDSHGAILQGLRGYAFSTDPKFIPLAATWLNGDRWRDEKPPNAPDDPTKFKLRPLGVGG